MSGPEIGRQFLEGTKYQHLGPSDQSRGLPGPSLHKPWPAGGTIIGLPGPAVPPPGEVGLTTAIRERRSVRGYAAEPMSLEDISYLLWCTQGVRGQAGGGITLRTVPSAGSRHPFETYLLATRVEGLQPGVYAYLADRHQLRQQQLGRELGSQAADICFGQTMVARGGATFIWAATAYRSAWRYGERAYRYLFLDAGHICAHLYLGAQAVGCGCCGIAAFDDDRMNRFLGLDGIDEFAVYLASVGKLPPPR